jgi:hypothetical protein
VGGNKGVNNTKLHIKNDVIFTGIFTGPYGILIMFKKIIHCPEQDTLAEPLYINSLEVLGSNLGLYADYHD